MNLGDILLKLEKFNNAPIRDSLDNFITSEWGSDRGSYRDMYVGFSQNNKDGIDRDGLILLIKKAMDVGTMEGYKGGDFDIDKSTLLKVGAYSISGNHIWRIIYDGDNIILDLE